jgi:beta-glucosidase
VDEAVRRILRIKVRLGLFENPYADPARAKAATLTKDNLEAARDSARKAMVLLKNEKKLLPLSRELRSLAVIGPLAEDRKAPLGSWSGLGSPDNVVTILEGIKSKLPPSAGLLVAKGCDIEGKESPAAGIAQAVEAARKAGLAVLVVGESAEMSGEAGSRVSLDLPGPQKDLVKAVVETGVPTVLVLVNGRPLTLAWEADHVTAILEAWQLGLQMGNAVADVLFGDYNPGGKLPATFPRAVGQVPLYYSHLNTGRPPSLTVKFTSRYVDLPHTPLYPFGYGLSYTSFKLGKLQLSSARIPPTGSLKVSAEVENLGTRAGDEVVQLYLRDLVASVSRPVKELKGFRRVSLAPGEKKTVEFLLGPRELGFYDETLKFVVEPGGFQVWVGASSADETNVASFEVTRP